MPVCSRGLFRVLALLGPLPCPCGIRIHFGLLRAACPCRSNTLGCRFFGPCPCPHSLGGIVLVPPPSRRVAAASLFLLFRDHCSLFLPWPRSALACLPLCSVLSGLSFVSVLFWPRPRDFSPCLIIFVSFVCDSILVRSHFSCPAFLLACRPVRPPLSPCCRRCPRGVRSARFVRRAVVRGSAPLPYGYRLLGSLRLVRRYWPGATWPLSAAGGPAPYSRSPRHFAARPSRLRPVPGSVFASWGVLGCRALCFPPWSPSLPLLHFGGCASGLLLAAFVPPSCRGRPSPSRWLCPVLDRGLCVHLGFLLSVDVVLRRFGSA